MAEGVIGRQRHLIRVNPLGLALLRFPVHQQAHKGRDHFDRYLVLKPAGQRERPMGGYVGLRKANSG